MEYHAIEDSVSFQEIEEILVEKARQGVDVRVVYDDVGSLVFINKSFRNRLEEEGIKCRVFNQIGPIFNVFMNNRDHRKISVIDGKIGFTGGYNLADEYFNLVNPYGHWKDTGIRIEGRPVDSLTLMFLEMWHASKYTRSINEDISLFINQWQSDQEDGGQGDHPGNKEDNIIIQPFAENPLKEELLAENAYMNQIKNARDYLYITTPYLLIDDNMSEELSSAAKRGVDVRIVTPGIPDKRIVYKMTRSYYGNLARNGVRIYEYMPGFIHAKQHLSDDRTAIIGTINMDYRSLYHHFENGVFLYNVDCIRDMRVDFEDLFDQSYEVTDKYASGRDTSLRIIQCLWRFVAPLM
jgi:phospholipase D domain protein